MHAHHSDPAAHAPRVISHNYNLSGGKWGNTPGVKQAFMEFFAGREHLIVEVAETQCLVIKP